MMNNTPLRNLVNSVSLLINIFVCWWVTSPNQCLWPLWTHELESHVAAAQLPGPSRGQGFLLAGACQRGLESYFSRTAAKHSFGVSVNGSLQDPSWGNPTQALQQNPWKSDFDQTKTSKGNNLDINSFHFFPFPLSNMRHPCIVGGKYLSKQLQDFLQRTGISQCDVFHLACLCYSHCGPFYWIEGRHYSEWERRLSVSEYWGFIWNACFASEACVCLSFILQLQPLRCVLQGWNSAQILCLPAGTNTTLLTKYATNKWKRETLTTESAYLLLPQCMELRFLPNVWQNKRYTFFFWTEAVLVPIENT